jgi:NAD(P)H dehydrogenase (quinone)
MNVFILHAHPEPKSFNAALTQTAVEFLKEKGHKVQVADFTVMNFDPVSDQRNLTSIRSSDFFKQQAEELHASETNGFSRDIVREIEKLEWCDALIMQFPLWWFGMPAILKGWVDRVLVMGRVYGGEKWYDNGAFKGKQAMVSVTTGGPDSIYQPDGLNGEFTKYSFLSTMAYFVLRDLMFSRLSLYGGLPM